MRAGGPNPGANIAAESSEPGKKSGGGPSTTEKSRLSPTQFVMLIVALIGAIGVLVAALITGGSTVVAAVISHGSNGTAPTPSQATAPAHPEVSGDMPEPNCPTCILGGQDLPRAGGRGQ